MSYLSNSKIVCSQMLTVWFSHRWDPQNKEWMKVEEPQLMTQDDTPHPHVPRSVQPRSTEPGLRNVGRLFQES